MSFFEDLARFGNATALIENDQPISYTSLQKACDAIAEQVTQPRALILICAKNDAATVTAYLTALQYGHVAIMLSADMSDALLEPLIATYTPNYIFKNGALETLHVTPMALHNDLALLIPTSGTTGSEKMVRLSYKNLRANTASILKYLRITCNDTVITTLPLFYVFGLSILHTHLDVGARIVLCNDTLMSREFWHLCDTYGATSFSGVPYHYEMLKRLGFEKLPDSIHTLTQAGGKMHESLVHELGQWCKAQNRSLYVMYGQSEATARISYLEPSRVLQKPTSIGRAISGGSLEIVDGELIYRGDNVMMGYAQNVADLAKGDTLGGVLHTGDLGYADNDGDYYITGRIKRFVKLGGLRISLDAIEQFLKNRGIEAMCAGDDNGLIIATCNDEKSAKTVVSQTFKLHHSLIQTRTFASLPTTASGKYDYKALL